MDTKREFTPKQKILITLYKGVQYAWYKTFSFKSWVKVVSSSVYFHIILLATVLFGIHKLLSLFHIAFSTEAVSNIALTLAGVIGASIAIIFSFSTFILQSTADLFSTRFLNEYIEDTREKVFFWLLVFFTVLALLVPYLFKIYQLDILLGILLLSFYLIFVLYKTLRHRINPETTLEKIKDDGIRALQKANRFFKIHAYVQNKIFAYKKAESELSMDIQYRSQPGWNIKILGSIKYLYEIGLRLLAKNEINSFNYSIKCIHDIYLKHLSLRNGNLIRTPASLFGGYVVDDQNFTNTVLEYLQSTAERIVQEKRKENIYYLLKIYESLIKNTLHITYADITSSSHKGNPILSIVLSYYGGVIEKLIESQEKDWILESVKSISTVSSEILEITDDYFEYDQISKLLGRITIACVATQKEAFVTELLKAYFNQIRISWNRYESNEILWRHIFEELKKAVLLCSVIESGKSLSMAGSFIGFHEWQVRVVNWIFNLEDGQQQKEYLEKFISFLERWSDFLIGLARDVGLNHQQLGLPIIQSVDNNLRVIEGIKSKFKELELDKLHQKQSSVLSWYFEKTEKVEDSFLFNLEQVLEILLREINYGLKSGLDVERQIKLYIRLIEQHFEMATLGHGYNHPRITVKLVHLGLLMNKYKKEAEETLIVAKIDELNKRYLALNSEFFELKKKEKNLMGPDEFQLCKEIHDLKNDILSPNRGLLTGVRFISSEEITETEWESFVAKIKYCERIEYITTVF